MTIKEGLLVTIGILSLIFFLIFIGIYLGSGYWERKVIKDGAYKWEVNEKTGETGLVPIHISK